MEQRNVRFADWIIASNDLIAECLIDRGLPSSILTVVMNSADEKLFRGPRGADPETIGEGDQNRPLLLMDHGTLTSIYGLDIAIEALAQVRTQRPDLNIEFHILGTGSAQDELLRQTEQLDLNGIIRFLGNVPLEQVPHYVAQCDVGLLSTRQDVFLDMSFSNKLVEYIIMDKPVIASWIKGYQRYFREESLAFFEPCDPASLGDTIIWMAQKISKPKFF